MLNHSKPIVVSINKNSATHRIALDSLNANFLKKPYSGLFHERVNAVF